MVRMTLEYLGDLQMKAKHGPSGTELSTDAPVDNQGRGLSFSPTDLTATSLGACMGTIMGIVAKRHQINLTGMTMTVDKEMISQPRRRIGKLTVHVKGPAVSETDRKTLENAALTCPVFESLHPDIIKDVKFEWGLK